jgi:hypothetical protein
MERSMNSMVLVLEQLVEKIMIMETKNSANINQDLEINVVKKSFATQTSNIEEVKED